VSVAKQSEPPKKEPFKNARDFRKRLERVLPNEAERLEFLECLGNEQAKSQRVLRWNPLKTASPEEVRSLKEELFGDAEPPALVWDSTAWVVNAEQVRRVDSHPLMGAGLLFVQEAGANEVVTALGIVPGMCVLDMCAAPGAKATQIAEALGTSGWLVANEADTRRAKKLDALLARHGSSRVSVYAAAGERLPKLLGLRFDAILVDAPCSGESLFFKRREDRVDVRDAEVRRCVQIQRQLLESAAELAADSARILYSTCTYSRDENEDRIEEFLKAHPEWALLESRRRWPHKDAVAGGYWALLERGRPLSEFVERREVEASSFEARHLVRHEFKVWNGETDAYASAMTALPRDETLRTVFVLENEARLKAFLRGESLTIEDASGVSEECDVVWAGRCVGIGKRVPGRLNNLLPKTLRASSF